jgi:hypothetical protein
MTQDDIDAILAYDDSNPRIEPLSNSVIAAAAPAVATEPVVAGASFVDSGPFLAGATFVDSGPFLAGAPFVPGETFVKSEPFFASATPEVATEPVVVTAAPVVAISQKPRPTTRKRRGEEPRKSQVLCTDQCKWKFDSQEKRHNSNQTNLRATKDREIAKLKAQNYELLMRLYQCNCWKQNS